MDESQLINCCRTCLKESCHMQSMSTQWKDQIQFWEMLIAVTGADRRNRVPFNICDKCEIVLIASYSFKLMCLETETLLNKFFDEEGEIAVKVNDDLYGEEDRTSDEAYNEFTVVEHIIHDENADVQWTVEHKPYEEDDVKSMTIQDETALLRDDSLNSEDVSLINSSLTDNNFEQEESSTIDGKSSLTNSPEREFIPSEEVCKSEAAPPESYSHHAKKAEVIALNKRKQKLMRNKELTLRRKCRLCNLVFADLKGYQLHHRQIHRSRTLCPFCGKLVSKHALEKHMISHTKTKDHLCTECGKSFTLGENLKKHWRIHTGDKRYTCEHCGEKFIHWNSKRSHIRTTHTGEKKYECNICGKRFAQSSNMFRHVRQHTGELPHECRFCLKKFMTTTELRNHIVVHTKEKNEICDICQKTFGTRKALRAHAKTHTGERNYVCTVCSKAFTQAHVLRTHMKTHPDCPIPPPGVILSQKALNRPPKLVASSSAQTLATTFVLDGTLPDPNTALDP